MKKDFYVRYFSEIKIVWFLFLLPLILFQCRTFESETETKSLKGTQSGEKLTDGTFFITCKDGTKQIATFEQVNNPDAEKDGICDSAPVKLGSFVYSESEWNGYFLDGIQEGNLETFPLSSLKASAKYTWQWNFQIKPEELSGLFDNFTAVFTRKIRVDRAEYEIIGDHDDDLLVFLDGKRIYEVNESGGKSIRINTDAGLKDLKLILKERAGRSFLNFQIKKIQDVDIPDRPEGPGPNDLSFVHQLFSPLEIICEKQAGCNLREKPARNAENLSSIRIIKVLQYKERVTALYYGKYSDSATYKTWVWVRDSEGNLGWFWNESLQIPEG